MSKILIIIPAFNESGSIEHVVTSIAVIDPSWEILVINDGSTDTTGEIIEHHNGLNVLHHCVNLGIGGAIQTGCAYAFANNFDFAVQVDGDGQHSASEIKKLLDVFSDTTATDVVIGSRFLIAGNTTAFRSTGMRRAGITILRRVIHWLTGTNVHDVTSGFRAYNRKALSLVSRHYPTDFPEPESFILFAKTGLSVKEVPVRMEKRLSGVSSIKGIKSIYYVIKVLVAVLIYSLRPARYYSGWLEG
jgi:glycosyltransferase involved in cell wall biosynthesis